MTRVHPASDLPLAWSIFSSSATAWSLGPEVLLRAIERGDFHGTLDGVDENGNSLLGALLLSSSTMHFRYSRWMRQNKNQLPLLRALIKYGSDPWCVDNEGMCAVDRMFHMGIDPLLVELAPSDPSGPEAWKLRRHSWSGAVLPWLHAVARHSSTAVSDLKELSGLPGVDFNQEDELGNTPLFHARSHEVVKFMLDRGANPSHRNHAQEGVIAAWAALGVRGNELSAMKQLLVDRGMEATRDQKISDFVELAKSSASSVLVPIYKELELDDILPELLENAARRLFSYSRYNRQEIRTSWGWLDFLASRPTALEAIPPELAACLNLIGHGECSREEDANLTARLRLREQMHARRPMSPIQCWELVDKGLFEENKYSVSCLYYFQEQVAQQITACDNDDQKSALSSLWYSIELRDDLQQLPIRDRSSSSSFRSRATFPWQRENSPPLDDRPEAWSLLLDRSSALSDEDFDLAIEHLIAQNTPTPKALRTEIPDLNPKRQAAMEQAIYLNNTPVASSSRPSRRI